MDLFLEVPIIVNLRKAGQVEETLSVSLREYTKSEKTKLAKQEDTFTKLIEKSQKHLRLVDKLETKIELQKSAEDFSGALTTFSELEEAEKKADSIADEIKELGGNDFYERKAKENFISLVSGTGKERLGEIAETKGYLKVMHLLNEEKKEVEKKQSGE